MNMEKQGLLLINLGTPDGPDTKSVRRYLREFLSDPRVVDIPTPIRILVLNLLILPFRPKQSAHAYQKIWQENGSPLLIYSRELAQKTADVLNNRYHVSLGMRYGNPSIESAVDELINKGCQKITVLPLFPQYSSAATGSAIEKTLNILKEKHNIPSFEIIQDFYNHPLFIDCYAQLLRDELSKINYDKLLFSYHGLPLRQIVKSGCSRPEPCQNNKACPADNGNRNCYRQQCYATSRALGNALGLDENQYTSSFQSRLGRIEWIKPYTDEVLPELAKQGVKKLAVACPAFTADCLETLEEIGMQAREQWQELGGEEFHLLPCLNADARWAKAISEMV